MRTKIESTVFAMLVLALAALAGWPATILFALFSIPLVVYASAWVSEP